MSRVNPRRVLAVFGGAFDPPHLGHVLLPGYVRAVAGVDHMLVAPCADHPLGKVMPPFATRLGWCRAAMAPYGPWVEVSTLERELAEAEPGPSYTLRLLDAVAARHPEARVRLVIGSDIVRSGQTAAWHRWDEIARRYDPLVVPRAGWSDGPCALPEVSSTEIRTWLAEDTEASWARIGAAVPAAVVRMLRPAGAPIWLVGHGHVVAHLQPWLQARGHQVVVLGGRAVADGSQALPAAGLPAAGPPAAGLPAAGLPAAVWIAVRDVGIVEVARGLVGRIPPGTVVVHAAGARRSEDVLGPLREAGHPVGSLHPAASMRAGLVRPDILGRAAFGIEGDDPAMAWARELVAPAATIDLRGLDARGRTAYHAACALLANHLAVLTLEAESVWAGLGADAGVCADFVESLLRSAVDNLLGLGVPAGISGPATRGDAAGIAAHKAALPPSAAALYDRLGTRLMALLQAAR